MVGKPHDDPVHFHAAHVAMGAPLVFVDKNTVLLVCGSNLCFWDTGSGEHEWLATSCAAIARACASPVKNLVAFAEGGTDPRVYVYSARPWKKQYELPGTTDLDLADLQFNYSGSRLYALAKAAKDRITVCSSLSGQALPGGSMDLPMKFDRVAVNPKNKDVMALVTATQVRMVAMTKSHQTYIMKLLPPSLPVDGGLSICAYSWTPGFVNEKTDEQMPGSFIVATRQSTLIIIGGDGVIRHACTTESPITSLQVLSGALATFHANNLLNIWMVEEEALPGEFTGSLLDPPAMEDSASEGGPHILFRLGKSADVGEQVDRVVRHRKDTEPPSNIVQFEAGPSFDFAILVTTSGDVWRAELSEELTKDKEPAEGEEEEEEAEAVVENIEFPLQWLRWFHTRLITAVCVVREGICASADEGGMVRIWEALGEPTCETSYPAIVMPSPITAMAAKPDGQGVVVGTEGGTIRFLDLQEWQAPLLGSIARISTAGVLQISPCPKDDFWAFATVTHEICFARWVEDHGAFTILGFVNIEGSCEGVDWSVPTAPDARPKFLIGGQYHHQGSGEKWPCLWALEPPPDDYEPRQKMVPKQHSPIWTMKVGVRVLAVKAYGDHVLLGFADGSVRQYAMPSFRSMPSLKHQIAQAMNVVCSHGQVITALHLSEDKNALISSSMDGSIRISSPTGTPQFAKHLHDPYQGGAMIMACSGSGKLVVSSTGVDGLMVWRAAKAGEAPEKLVVEDAPIPEELEEELQVDGVFQVWEPATQDEAAHDVDEMTAEEAEANTRQEALRKTLLLEVESVRKKLADLVEANSHCPEIERLQRSEFCIDVEERERIAAKTMERCNALRSQIQSENLARELIRERLVAEFWETMQIPGSSIFGMQNPNLTVSNYPMRVKSGAENSRLHKLKCLREVELREKEFLASKNCPAMLRRDGGAEQPDVLFTSDVFASGSEDYIVNWFSKRAAQSKAENAAGEEDAAEAAAAAAKLEKEMEGSVRRLLYEPFELLTNCRRRVQVVLLQELAQEYRAKFNVLFNAMMKEKAHSVEAIEERNKKLRSILVELKMTESVVSPPKYELENPKSVLTVRDDELKAEKWISPEEKERLDAIKAAEDERMRKLRENDSGARALMQMMGGTLKTKKDLSPLEIILEREEWMDMIPLDEMSEEQRAAVAEFERKEKELQEAQDKYRKTLHTELAKLRQEVVDNMSSFDDDLRSLHHKRFQYDTQVYCQELYCVRLQLALVQNQEDSSIKERLTQQQMEKERELDTKEHQLQEFKSKCRRHQESHNAKKEAEHQLITSFRQQREFSNVSADVLRQLQAMFRQPTVREEAERQTDLRKSRTSNVRGDAITPGAPFGLPEEKYLDIGLKEDVEPTEEDAFRYPEDAPEGVDEIQFRRMLELRREKAQAQYEVKKSQETLDEMTTHLAHLEAETADCKGQRDRVRKELEEHCGVMDKEVHDIELMFQLKQGQVEVPQHAVVTDYSDAVVLDTEVVASRNRRIQEIGKEKVNVLHMIKDFRKKLSLMDWEQKMLALKMEDLEERTKDVHMLRVTKDLQATLKGGEEGKNKHESDMLERKIEHLKTTTKQKEGQLQRQYNIVKQQRKVKEVENAMLERKLRELQQNVVQREHIRRLRAPQAGGAAAPTTKSGQKRPIIGGGGKVEVSEAEAKAAANAFSETKARRALLDAARAHTSEIDRLRRELDRLRQKTFPSFVQLHQQPQMSPD